MNQIRDYENRVDYISTESEGETPARTAGKIKDALLASKGHESVEVIECDEYKDAVDIAYSKATDGDVVLLSPASTSFDRFKNFEERGRLFKDLVNSL